MIFPEKFTSTAILNFNAHFKRYLVGQLKWLITEDEKFKEIVNEEQQYFVRQIQPKNINSADSENVTYKGKREFERLCVILETHGLQNIKSYSMLKFYTLIKHYEDKKNKQSGTTKRRR